MRATLRTQGRGEALPLVGQPVADQLARDWLERIVREHRKAKRARAEGDGAAEKGARFGEGDRPVPLSDEELGERRRTERAAEQERRRAAAAHNVELGAAVVKCFARVKLDARVVKLLACLDLGGELDRIAMRGAPLRLPGLSIARNPQQCVAKIEEIASTGVNHMILCVTDPAIVKGFTQKDVDVPDAKTQLRLIHDEVMPAFAA